MHKQRAIPLFLTLYAELKMKSGLYYVYAQVASHFVLE